MKTLFLSGAAIAILGLAVAPISGQTQSTTTSSTTYVQTSKLVGTKVKSSQGEEIGVIKDVVLDRNTGIARNKERAARLQRGPKNRSNDLVSVGVNQNLQQ